MLNVYSFFVLGIGSSLGWVCMGVVVGMALVMAQFSSSLFQVLQFEVCVGWGGLDNVCA